MFRILLNSPRRGVAAKGNLSRLIGKPDRTLLTPIVPPQPGAFQSG
ncbi:hypothetical protein CHELA20_51093 [Hyphomicrobiales bacterium]|nr:hypothetical protein CHELA20_51093 [Hyphomicrobiales bacterium]